MSRKPTHGMLVGSKRRLREILTGENDPAPPPDRLADDLLIGAAQIAEFTGLSERQIYHQCEVLGLRRLGARPNEEAAA
jgi:hypothetical protein